jgi:aldehyde dehydrogenase
MAAKKRAIVAGPGNPPVVVDETADLARVAASIVKGAGYDNNLLCIAEKQISCVEPVFDRLMAEMTQAGAHALTHAQVDTLTRRAFTRGTGDGDLHVNRAYMGQDASVLAEAAGVRVAASTSLLFGETDPTDAFVPSSV